MGFTIKSLFSAASVTLITLGLVNTPSAQAALFSFNFSGRGTTGSILLMIPYQIVIQTHSRDCIETQLETTTLKLMEHLRQKQAYQPLKLFKVLLVMLLSV